MKKHARIELVMPWEQEISWKAGQGIRDYALEQDLQWEFFSHPPHMLPEVFKWEVQGVIVLGAKVPDNLSNLQPKKLCIVNISTNPDIIKAPRVDGDPYAAGALAAEHLNSLGFFRGAWLSVNVPALQERVRGFKEKMEELGGSASALSAIDKVSDFHRPETVKNMSRAVKQLEKPAAIYCINDNFGRTLIQICRDEGIHIPEEIAVLATENSESICESVHPYLSSIDIGYREIGRRAAKTLHELMLGKSVPECTLLPPLRVVSRQSTEVLAIEDERLRTATIFLRNHYLEKVDINQLAASVGLSRRGLEYLFRNKLQRSPHEEIMRLRFEQAKLLLRTTRLNIEEIAERAGFNTGHYLCYMFKRHVGKAPSTYRKAHIAE